MENASNLKSLVKVYKQRFVRLNTQKQKPNSFLTRFYKAQFLKQEKLFDTITWLLRFGVFGTFLGHGINAIQVKPNWIPLITAFGFSNHFARQIMPLIGILDIVVAVCAIIYPKRFVFIWAFIWAFLTALSRPISGEPMIEFIERASNWFVPLALCVIISRKKN